MNTPAPKPSAHLLVVLAGLIGAGPLFMLALSSTSALVVERFEITAGQLGLVASIVFGSAAVVARPLGRWADVVSPRWQLLFSFGGVALSLLVVALTTSYLLICLVAVLAGASQAIANPTTNRMLLEAVSPAQRASWIGMKQSGVPIAQLFGGAFFPVVAVWLGWPAAAVSGVALVVLLNIYGLWVLRRHYEPRAVEPETSAPPASEPAEPSSSHPPHAPGKSSVIALLTLFSLLFAFSLQALIVYIPLFAVEQLEFSLVAGGLTITVGGVIGIFARLWWARRIGAGHRPSSLLLAIVSGSLVSPVLLLAAQLGGFSALVWGAAVIHGATALGANVIINAAVMRAAPPGQVGRASGATSMGMYGGFALGPLAVGWLRDLGADFTLSWTVTAVVYLCAVPILLILRSRGSEGDQRW